MSCGLWSNYVTLGYCTAQLLEPFGQGGTCPGVDNCFVVKGEARTRAAIARRRMFFTVYASYGTMHRDAEAHVKNAGENRSTITTFNLVIL